MRKIFLLLTALTLAGTMTAKEWVYTLTSPDGRLTTHITTGDGGVTYDVVYQGVTLLMPSHIGLNYTLGDGWEDQDVHNDSQQTRQKAFQMGENLLQYVFTM